MSGIRTLFVLDRTEGDSLLATLLNFATGPKPQLYDSIGFAFVQRVQLGFNDQRDPWGEKWHALAMSTILKRREGPGGTRSLDILRDKGLLMSSWTYDASGYYVEIGSADIRAAIHQFGGQTGRGHAATIPARPMVPERAGGIVDLPQPWVDDMEDIAEALLDEITRPHA